MGTVDLQLTQAEKESIVKGKSHVFKDMPHGRAGDTFDVDGRRFEVIDVCERPISRIDRYSVLREYSTLPTFIEEWNASHSSPCGPETFLFIHWFRNIGLDS
jgi:hypothetical protein